MKQFTHSSKIRVLAVAFLAVWSLLAVASPSSSSSSGGGSAITATQVESQPNLMILLSNSYSMSKNMLGTADALSNNGLPEQNSCATNYTSTSTYNPAPAFADGASGACGGDGTYFPYGSYGNFTDSRFYIAKQTLYNLLQQGYANGINLGFATYRQAMGMQMATVSQSSNAIYPNIYLSGMAPGDPSTFPSGYESYTQAQLSDLANNPLNFAYVSWWPIYNSQYTGANGDGNAFLGNYSNDPYKSDSLFGNVSYLAGANGGGLPYSVSYPQGTLQNSSTSNYSYYGGGGLTLQAKQAGAAEPVLNLCQTYYNSQANTFQAIYTQNSSDGSPILFQQTFPNKYQANTLYYVALGSPLIVNGQIVNPPYNQPCNVSTAPTQVKIASGNVVSSSAMSNGDPAYFNYIPNFDSGSAAGDGSSLDLPEGKLSGWSGAVSVISASGSAGASGTTNSVSFTNGNTVTSQYPATPQSESILGSWNASGAKWMGVFVNLPSSSQPVNNVPVISRLINPAYPMESSSGLDYSYSNQTLNNSSGKPRSIVNSSMSGSYNGHQEPLYDSLVDATAYWNAFEKANPYAECQNNNMLVIFDGISDGHPNMNATEEQNALINQAKVLYSQYHVKIYVVIISNNAGDITQANALAAAGGTQTAFQATDAGELYNALQATFVSIAKESLSASFGVSPQVSSGNYSFATVNVGQATGQGDLAAYQILSNGGLNSPTSLTPSWDAESLMASRGSQLLSTNFANPSASSKPIFTSGSETPLTSLASGSPNDFGNPTAPGASTIAGYTINPSVSSGAYLGGRQAGWYIGLPSGAKPVVVTPPNEAAMLGNTSYLAFASARSARQNTVLFSANDGFLYAIGYNNTSQPSPTVQWAWIPHGLLPQLQNYGSFWQTGSMSGGFTETDAIDANGNWHSYVVGSALSGGILYDLLLTGKTTVGLSHTVAEYDLNAAGNTFVQAPAQISSAPAIYQDASGNTQAAWSLNEAPSSGGVTPGVFLMNVGTGAGAFITAPAALTSAPIFGPDGSLYIAAGSKIYQMTAADVASAESNQAASSSYRSIGDMFNSVATVSLPSTSPSGASTSLTRLQISYASGAYWMTAESSNGLWTLQQLNGSWSLKWYSGLNASAVFSNGKATPSASTSSSSASSPSSTSIPALPTGAVITDDALVVNNSVILPVSVTSNSSDTCSLPTANYYFYKLTSGMVPSGAFMTIGGSAVAGVLQIGLGTAFTPSVSMMGGRLLLQSGASNTGASQSFPAVTTTGLPLAGPSAWRLVLSQ